jgi:hypothetical protein
VFSIEDLFTFGLGCDIAGGYLVARGLLASMPVMTRRAATFWDLNPTTFIAQVEDRISGLTGLVALTVGFSAQLVGYIAVIGGAAVSTGGSCRAITAGLVAIGPLAAILLGERRLRPKLVWRHCLEGAHFTPNKNERSDLPYGRRLHTFGSTLGYTRLDGESDADYARRVWNVERISDEDG